MCHASSKVTGDVGDTLPPAAPPHLGTTGGPLQLQPVLQVLWQTVMLRDFLGRCHYASLSPGQGEAWQEQREQFVRQVRLG